MITVDNLISKSNLVISFDQELRPIQATDKSIKTDILRRIFGFMPKHLNRSVLGRGCDAFSTSGATI